MAQCKIFALRETLAASRKQISDALHRACTSALKVPEEKRFQRFFPMEREDFIFPADRSDRYLIVEVSLMSGRTEETRKAFVRAIFNELAQAGFSAQDVEVTLLESHPSNWGFRGMHGDEAPLSYPIQI